MVMATPRSFAFTLLLLAVNLSSINALLIPSPSIAQSNADILRGGANVARTFTSQQQTTQLKQSTEVSGGAAASESGGTATISVEVFNLIKSIVGAGVLSLPYGIAAYGNAPSAVIPATVLITLIGIISGYTFGLIGRVCQATNTESYSDAWDATVGTKTSWLIAFSCFIDCFAGNLSYSMILADTGVNLLASFGYAITRTQALLGVTGGVLLPLCLLKNLASLAPFSLLGIMGVLYTAVIMGVRYFGGAYHVAGGALRTSVMALPAFGSAGAQAALSPKALILTCMLSNAYIAHFNAAKFLKELKNNTMARFHQVIGWSFGTSILLYASMAALGFLTFGSVSDGLILNNYSNKDALMGFARLAIALSVTFSYPLCFMGSRDSLLDLFKVPQSKRTNKFTDKVTLGLLATVTLAAAKLTDLGLVASVGGATFGTALVFIYPTLMFMKVKKNQGTESKIAGLIALLGVAMGAVGTVLCFE